MTITDQRVFDAVNNLRAYVSGCGGDVEQEMNDDIEELIAAVTDMVAKRLREVTHTRRSDGDTGREVV